MHSDSHRATLHKSLLDLRGCETSTDLQHSLRSIRHAYNVEHIALLAIQAGGRALNPLISVTTYPLDWINIYKNFRFIEIDPVVRLSLDGFLPVQWRALSHQTAKSLALFKLAQACGIGSNGVSFPIRGPHGERSVFSFSSSCSDESWEKSMRNTIFDMQIIAQVLHEKVFTISSIRVPKAKYRLSLREAQCLNMIARGLLSKQIPSVLPISESAVRKYLKSAQKKLDAKTTSEAVFIFALREEFWPFDDTLPEIQ